MKSKSRQKKKAGKGGENVRGNCRAAKKVERIRQTEEENTQI
jgi:hypothetical protein